MILVTGGSGFIGSNFIRLWLAQRDEPVLNLDALTYAGNPRNLADLADDPRYRFERLDLREAAAVEALFERELPRAVIHFAAESHVDRSIDSPQAFLDTNVMGTANLLNAALKLFRQAGSADDVRFVHVSTDEVYGSLSPQEPAFTEAHPHRPNSPYSASKAASDHLVRAWHHTYGLPVVTGNCSNNYGPFQFPEKLIPLMIERALAGESLPVYGDGQNVRDWLYVTDHCRALMALLDEGALGATYNIGGKAERTNLEVVHALTDALQRLRPRDEGYRGLIRFVADRPGHDQRYAIDSTRVETELGWHPEVSFEQGLEQTLRWYLENRDWVESVKTGAYRQWVGAHYGAEEMT